jgi:IS30 family transposase
MNYKQLTEGDRYTLAALKRQGLSFTNIAKVMNRHRSTIYREVKRNSCWIIDGSYRPTKAQRRTRARRRRSRRNQHFTPQDYKEVRKLIRKDWSPEQITGHLKTEGKHRFSLAKYINIFSETNETAVRYGNTYAVHKSEDVNVIMPTIVAAGLPISVILQSGLLR